MCILHSPLGRSYLSQTENNQNLNLHHTEARFRLQIDTVVLPTCTRARAHVVVVLVRDVDWH